MMYIGVPGCNSLSCSKRRLLAAASYSGAAVATLSLQLLLHSLWPRPPRPSRLSGCWPGSEQLLATGSCSSGLQLLATASDTADAAAAALLSLMWPHTVPMSLPPLPATTACALTSAAAAAAAADAGPQSLRRLLAHVLHVLLVQRPSLLPVATSSLDDKR